MRRGSATTERRRRDSYRGWRRTRAAANLFGTASQGGPYGYGTVFNIPRCPRLVFFGACPTGYASTPTVLPALNDTGGYGLNGLIADFAGNLFGTTLRWRSRCRVS